MGSERVIYNPNNRPRDELPTILGFNNGGGPGWLLGCLLAEDGAALGSHICSDESFMPGDLGIVTGGNPARHNTFRAHYPEGYRMEFVSPDDPRLEAAYQRHLAQRSAATVPDGDS